MSLPFIRHSFIKKGFKPIVLYIYTTLEDSLEEIVSLYKKRWEVETDFRTLKTHLNMEQLDVQSPSMARKEIIFGI